MIDDRPSPNARSKRAKAPTERESRNAWEDEGGSVDERVPNDRRHADTVISGRIVQRGSSDAPYTVELTHEDGHKTEHLCRDMREGEAFIRGAIPTPPKRDTSRDQGPGNA